jgi:hypothetical protein
MKDFLREHASLIYGVLSGFDRVRFRGTIRSISYPKGLLGLLWILKVLLKAFKSFVEGTSQKIKRSTEQLAKATPVGRVVYLSGMHDKQEVIEDLMRKHKVADDFTGLIAVLSCVENCSSFEIRKNAAEQKLELMSAYRKCLHYYLYIRDPRFGMMHIRLMTWFPMRVQICLNGREWLARQLDAAGITYERLENTFAWVADFAKAQELLTEQTKTDWPTTLSMLIQTYHPAFAALLTQLQLPGYYWTTEQTEWATDVVFRSAEALRPLYRRLVQHAIQNLSCVDVMRFLQQRLTKSGELDQRFCGEIVSDVKTRVEGTRAKHRLGQNSLKMYDKFGRVLRIETTIHHAEGLKVYRRKENDPEGSMRWHPLRRGVADMHRRCELSQKANETYLDVLAVVEVPETVESLVLPVSKALVRDGRRHRGLNVMSIEDGRLLQIINDGQFTISGFRNRDLREQLFGSAPTEAKKRKKQSGQMTRRLMLLRAHGLIQKIPKSHRYRITSKGRTLAVTVSCAAQSKLKNLAQAA